MFLILHLSYLFCLWLAFTSLFLAVFSFLWSELPFFNQFASFCHSGVLDCFFCVWHAWLLYLFLVSGFLYAWPDLSDFGLRDCLGEFLQKPLLGEKKDLTLKLVSP